MGATENGAAKIGAYVVRQDRIECDPDRFSIKIADTTIARIVNFSAFGIAVESAGPLNATYEDVLLCVDDYPISQIKIRKVAEHRQSPPVLTGFAVEGSPIDVEAALALKDLNAALVETNKMVESDQEIRPEFKLQVLEIKDVLSKLEDRVNELDVSTFHNSVYTVSHFEDRVATRLSSYLASALNSRYRQLQRSLEGLNGDQIDKHFEYFRRAVGRIIYQSAYAHRAYTKPKGYAGDYEMMNNVYRRELRGDSLFAKCLQRYFVDEPAGQAVRNRELYFRGKIVDLIKANKGKRLKILSVAAGPAVEIQNIFSEGADLELENVDFYLLDQDVDALKFAQRRIQEIARANRMRPNLHLINLNIKYVIQNGLPDKGMDFIYSAGLFDYFTDPVAVYAAAQLCRATNPGGDVIIGNFSVQNPNQFAMNLIMDWNLVYRTEEDLKNLFGQLGSLSVEAEPQGINLFANIKVG